MSRPDTSGTWSRTWLFEAGPDGAFPFGYLDGHGGCGHVRDLVPDMGVRDTRQC